MKKYINNLFIFLIIPLSADFCIPSKKENRRVYLMNEEFKSYVVFPKGSYWVYEEKNSGAQDSIYILEKYLNIGSYKYYDYDYESLAYYLYSSYTKDTLYGRGGQRRHELLIAYS